MTSPARRWTDANGGTPREVGVRIAGRGGQGVMLAGLLLAQAGMNDGLHVVQTQAYGPEARLGAAKSDVILSPTQVGYPEVTSPDVFLCLSHDALAAFGQSTRPGALSIIEERAGDGPGAAGTILLPLIATARDCGATIATNIVALGALVGRSGIVSEQAMRDALAARVAPESLAANLRAFDAGLALADD
jgi:2-oxoglutarate ferredoxin oxidoreductase subunit gamma